jgi:hypothetical protein
MYGSLTATHPFQKRAISGKIAMSLETAAARPMFRPPKVVAAARSQRMRKSAAVMALLLV